MSHFDTLNGAIVGFLNYGTGTAIDLTEGTRSNSWLLSYYSDRTNVSLTINPQRTRKTARP
jgi:hypothetical protein